MPPPTERLRLAELLASLSLATDLGTGQPLGHGMRTCLLAMAIGGKMGCDDSALRSLYQVSLLRFVGCTADAAETAQAVGGDEITFNRAMSPVISGSFLEGTLTMIRTVGSDEPVWRRGRLLLGVMSDPKATAEGLAAHCEVAAMMASRLGLEPGVISALRSAYERWDGKGYPAGLGGEEIPFEIRVCTVARDADLFINAGADAEGILTQRRGKGYDPAVVDAWLALEPRHVEAYWEAVMGAEPEPHAHVNDLAHALTVVADFVDLKSSWTRGHSRHVARLARKAAEEAGHSSEQIELVSRAALVHDLGRTGVEAGVWDKPGPLSTDEWEKVRLHPYLSHRILSRCPGLADLAALAASHHERSDGSGYHRQLEHHQLTASARILAAADVLSALLAPRPHRPAFAESDAFSILTREADAGRLDPDAVACVVRAAGGTAQRPIVSNPDGLTDREIEVLRHLASGHTNRAIADLLFISPKTVGRHVENIYAKIGVATRAGAAVYAMDRDLLG